MLKSKKERTKFFNCYNKQNNLKSEKFLFKDVEINFSKEEIKKINRVVDSYHSKQFLIFFDKTLKEELTREKIYQILKRSQKFNNFLNDLLQAYLYIMTGNQGRAENIIKKLLENEIFYHVLRSDIKNISIEKQQYLFLDILEKIETELENKKLFFNLIAYIGFQSTGEFSEEILDSFDVPEDIPAIRRRYSSIQYGEKFPHVWGPFLFNRSSSKEYDQYLKQSILSEMLTKDHLSSLLFLRSLDGVDKTYKNNIIQMVKKTKNSMDYYERLIYFRLLDDENFRKYLSAHLKEFNSLIINEKRNFFKTKLKSGLLTKEISIIQLLSLGDLDWEYLYQFIGHEKRKF